MRSLPEINPSYWQSLVAASIFGTNAGDFVAGYLHLGHLAGLPYLALIFTAILAFERQASANNALYFWAAIITMRTAATNVGDAFHDFGISFSLSIPIVLAAFISTVALYAHMPKPTGVGDKTVGVNFGYWLCMMLAGILGTVGGDFAAFRLGLTPPGAAGLFGLLLLGSIIWFSNRGTLLKPMPYWTTVALIRTAGTAAGDTVAHALGLRLSTAITGLFFIGLVTYRYHLQSKSEAIGTLGM